MKTEIRTLADIHALQKTPEFQARFKAFKESLKRKNATTEKQAERDAFLKQTLEDDGTD